LAIAEAFQVFLYYRICQICQGFQSFLEFISCKIFHSFSKATKASLLVVLKKLIICFWRSVEQRLIQWFLDPEIVMFAIFDVLCRRTQVQAQEQGVDLIFA